jgi:hypothetical protein
MYFIGNIILVLSLLAPVQDPLAQFNVAFRQAYAKAKADTLAQDGTVLLVSGDWLMLYRNNAEVAREPIRPARYHRLKAVAHVPLALQVLLSAPGGAPEGTLRTLRALAAAARSELGSWCSGPALARQERILDASLRLLDDRLGPAGLAEGRLSRFTADLGPLVLANADEAAGLELDALHGKVLAVRKGMDPADWRALRVVIIGSHMAREGEITLQYFLRLMGEPREGGRVIYAEGLWQPRDALDLLATHQVDAAAGAAFFGDPMRMHRDILADRAEGWLSVHLPAPNPALD